MCYNIYPPPPCADIYVVAYNTCHQAATCHISLSHSPLGEWIEAFVIDLLYALIGMGLSDMWGYGCFS